MIFYSVSHVPVEHEVLVWNMKVEVNVFIYMFKGCIIRFSLCGRVGIVVWFCVYL